MVCHRPRHVRVFREMVEDLMNQLERERLESVLVVVGLYVVLVGAIWGILLLAWR